MVSGLICRSLKISKICPTLNSPQKPVIKLLLIVKNYIIFLLTEQDQQDKIDSILEKAGFGKIDLFHVNLLDQTQKNSVLSCLEFIIKNSIRFDIHQDVLMKDLIDLGLPKGNCGSITKQYGKNREALKQKMIQSSMRSKRLTFTITILKLTDSQKLITQSTKFSQRKLGNKK